MVERAGEQPKEQPEKVEQTVAGAKLTEAEIKEVEEGKWHTVKEIATKLDYSNAWISGLCEKGRIHAIKPVGGQWRIPDSEYGRVMEKGIPPAVVREKHAQSTGPIVIPREVQDKIAEKKKGAKEEKELPFPWNLFEL